MDSRAQNPAPQVAPAAAWRNEARYQQESFHHSVGDIEWISYHRRLPSICNLLLSGWCSCFEIDDGCCVNDHELLSLKRNIGFIAFGEPSEERSEKNEWTGYGSGILKKINSIFEIIVRTQPEKVLVSSLLVIVKRNDEESNCFTVFRIPKPSSCKGPEMFWFVDYEGRIYKGWEKFLNNNLLPAGECCYPKNGVYKNDIAGKLDLCYDKTLASKLKKKLVNGLDMTASVGSVIGGAGAILLPMTAAAAAAPVFVGGCIVTGAYGVVRSSISQADRGLHGQSIGVTDRESLRNWLSIAGSAVGVAAGGAAKYVTNLARTGQTLPKIGSCVTNGLRGTSLFINGVGLADSFWTLKERKDAKELTAIEIFQFSAHALFFLHAAVNTTTARQLYESEQDLVINNHKDSLRSNRHRRMFDGIARETTKNESTFDGKAKVIRGINHISNADDVYAQMVKSRKVFYKAGVKVKFDNSGVLITNDTGAAVSAVEGARMGVSLSKFSNLVTDGSKHVFSVVSTGAITVACVIGQVASRTYAIITEVLSYLRSLVGDLINNVTINTLFEFMNFHCDKIPGGEYIKDILRIIVDLKYCRTPMDCVEICTKVWKFLHKVYDNHIRVCVRTENHENTLTALQENDQTTQNTLTALQDQTTQNTVTALQENDQTAQQEISEESIREVFENIRIEEILHGLEDRQLMKEEVYHFPEHRSWSETGILTVEEYLTIAQNVLGVTCVSDANIFMRGSSSACVFLRGVGVVFISSKHKENIIVIQKSLRSWSN